MKLYFVYIVASKKNGTIYIGVTNNLSRRIYEHKNKLIEGFTKQHKVDKLVYMEEYKDVDLAIKREKQLKGWRREKKLALIEKNNYNWIDLYEKLNM
jgi:putative endonuclease